MENFSVVAAAFKVLAPRSTGEILDLAKTESVGFTCNRMDWNIRGCVEERERKRLQLSPQSMGFLNCTGDIFQGQTTLDYGKWRLNAVWTKIAASVWMHGEIRYLFIILVGNIFFSIFQLLAWKRWSHRFHTIATTDLMMQRVQWPHQLCPRENVENGGCTTTKKIGWNPLKTAWNRGFPWKQRY